MVAVATASSSLGVRARVLFPGDVLHFLKNPGRRKMTPPLLDFWSHDDYMRRDDLRAAAGLALSADGVV